MKRQYKIITIAFLVFAITLGLFLGGKYYSALAKEIYPDLYGLVEKNQPKLINDAATQITSQPSQKSESTPQEAVDQLKESLDQWDKSVFTQSGWIHFVYMTTSAVENGVVLPDGSLMSQNYVTDGWYLINDQGLVEKHVISLIDDSGNVLQREVFMDGILINLTLNDKMQNIQPYKLKLDLGLSQEMLTMEKAGAILSNQKLSIDGQSVSEFSVLGTFDKPTILNNSPLQVESIQLVISFDEQTGVMYEVEKIWRLTDGSEILFEKNQFVSLNRAELPGETAQFLEVAK